MNKINFSTIIISHINTLRGDNGRLQWGDLVLFYILPLSIGILAFFICWEVPEKALELSISVFSIFAALLLSVQVALYSVSLRGITKPEDQNKIKNYERRLRERKLLIKELNDNVSYLMLLSVITVSITLGMFFVSSPKLLWSALVIAFFIHFLLTILMVVKRASIVFSREYESDT